MKELIEYIEGKLPISNEILSELKARVVERNLVKGEVILSENSAKKIQVFVASGCLRSFYKTENKVYTIPRMVYNKKGDYFYSDIIQPSAKQQKDYITPTNRFGACWVYSQQIMKEWIRNTSFLNFNHPNRDGGIRVKMGTGYLEKKAVVPIDKKKKEPCIKCIHLGYSGNYYFKHPKGYHTLAMKNLF